MGLGVTSSTQSRRSLGAGRKVSAWGQEAVGIST